MTSVIDRLLSTKISYAFQNIQDESFKAYLVQELLDQLNDLEGKWRKIHYTEQVLEYRVQLERARFRLEEIKRFLLKNSGPKAVLFICGEIHDFVSLHLRSSEPKKTKIPSQEQEQISQLITIISTYYFAKQAELDLVSIQDAAEQLKRFKARLLEILG
ncbi:hypothetical protein WDW89_07695 [Deltaproteobacteria bacterium TL4]